MHGTPGRRVRRSASTNRARATAGVPSWQRNGVCRLSARQLPLLIREIGRVADTELPRGAREVRA